MTQKGKFHKFRSAPISASQWRQNVVLFRITSSRGVGCPTTCDLGRKNLVRATMLCEHQGSVHKKLGRALLFAHCCFVCSSSVSYSFCQVFVLLRVCSELFRKDPLRIPVLVPPYTPLQTSGHLESRSPPSRAGPRSVTRVFRPASPSRLRHLE